VALTGQEGLFPLEKGLEIVLGDLIDESFDPATVVHPFSDGVVEGLGNVGGPLLAIAAGVEIESRMFLAALAAAVGFATGAVPQHQRAAEKGFIGEVLSGAGACVSFRGGTLSS
jgi:hypothetical protein